MGWQLINELSIILPTQFCVKWLTGKAVSRVIGLPPGARGYRMWVVSQVTTHSQSCVRLYHREGILTLCLIILPFNRWPLINALQLH